MSLFYDLLAVFSAVFVVLFSYFQWTYNYWERKKVPFLKPSIPFGNTGNPLNNNTTRRQDLVVEWYRQFKAAGHKYGGVYVLHRPVLIATHPDLIRNIFNKDFRYFTDRGLFYDEKTSPLSANLFNLDGLEWKHMRAKLSPTFTSGKMKMMYETMLACSEPLVESIGGEVGSAVDIKEFLGRFTTDVIGRCAFGIDCNSFKNPNSEFRKQGKAIFAIPNFMYIIKAIIRSNFPNIARILRLQILNPGQQKFFIDMVTDTINHRKRNNLELNDFMQLLIKLMEGEEGLSFSQVAAQVFVFFLAGFETSSSTMTFALYELAKNKDLQQKARMDVTKVLEQHDGKLTYDSLGEMKYLHQIVDETLRKWPAGETLFRVCSESYKLPNTDVVIDKGVKVWISVKALHWDPEWFPEPERFDPERFSAKNKENIKPFTYLPFGEGPRNCLGLRFGLMQVRLGLAVLLKNYKFDVSSKTKEPIELERSMLPVVKGGIWLNVERI
nr:cytochrome P450 monooxygenase CYP6SY1 [Lasioderma serricorne]